MSGKPLPTALKVFRNTDRADQLNEFEPMPDSDKIAPPDNLSKPALKYWDHVVEQLKSAGIMTNLDNHALGMYCEAYARWVEANDKISEHGMVIKAPSGYPVQSPYLSISNRAFEQMRAMLSEFGMTPSSRSRIKAEPKKVINEFDQF